MVDKRRAVAIHEAAHAVAAWRFDIGVQQVSIVTDESNDSAGHVSHDNPFYGTDLEVIDREELADKLGVAVDRAVISLAGAEAERQYLGIEDPEGSERDRKTAIDILSYFVGGNRELQALVDYVVIVTEEYIAADHIKERTHRVADALEERQELNAEQFASIMEEQPSK